MTMGKRQLVLAALIVALGAAVYLNWQFSGNQLQATDAVNSARTLGEAQLVSNSSKTASSKSSTSDSSVAVQTGVTSDTYFTQAQLSRRQAKDSAVDMLTKIVADTKQGDTARKEAVDKAAVIAQNMVKESNIENLIKAKGFADCLVFIQNGECSVVVKSKDTAQSAAIVIKDIVAGQSGISYDKIKINFV